MPGAKLLVKIINIYLLWSILIKTTGNSRFKAKIKGILNICLKISSNMEVI